MSSRPAACSSGGCDGALGAGGDPARRASREGSGRCRRGGSTRARRRGDRAARGGRGDRRPRHARRQARRRPLRLHLGGRADLQGRRASTSSATRAAGSATSARSSRTRWPTCAGCRSTRPAPARLRRRARDGRAGPRRARGEDAMIAAAGAARYALNFYSPVVEAQLRSHRKTATIRLGDKSRKYQKGMIVAVLVRRALQPAAEGLRRGDRQGRGEDARRALAERDRARQPGAPPPGRAWRASSASSTTGTCHRGDTVTVIRFSAIKPLARTGDSAGACSVSAIEPTSARRTSRPRASPRDADGALQAAAHASSSPHGRARRSARAARRPYGADLRIGRRGARPGSGCRTPRSRREVDENGASQRAAAQLAAAGHVSGTSASSSKPAPARAPQLEAERRPVAEDLAALLAEPVGRLAHAPTIRYRGRDDRAAVDSAVSSDRGGAVAIAREAEPSGSLQEVKEWGLDREDLLGIYRNMLITRGVEERGHILYRQGKIPGSFYTGRGNEAASVGVATAMGADDVGTPLHRDMGVHITRGVEPWRIFASTWAAPTGPTHGQGRQRPHGRHPPRPDRDGQPPAGDAAGRGRLRARLPHPRGAARRGRLVRRGRDRRAATRTRR